MLPSLLAEFASPGPLLFQLGPLSIRWYGLLIAIAVLLGVSLSSRLARRRALDPDLINDLVIWLVIAAIPCARLYYVLFEWHQYAANPGEILAIWHGGIAIHGAIIGGTLAALLFARLHRVSFWSLADVVAPSLALGQAIGRWGNFFNSEAFGNPTSLPWKLYIPPQQRPSQYWDQAYFHPTFLYESLWNLAVAALLLWWFRQQPAPKRGAVFCLYAVTYSLGRVWIEGLRTDSLMLGPLKVAQLVSLAGVLLGGLGLWWLYGRRRPLPDVIDLPQG